MNKILRCMEYGYLAKGRKRRMHTEFGYFTGGNRKFIIRDLKDEEKDSWIPLNKKLSTLSKFRISQVAYSSLLQKAV